MDDEARSAAPPGDRERCRPTTAATPITQAAPRSARRERRLCRAPTITRPRRRGRPGGANPRRDSSPPAQGARAPGPAPASSPARCLRLAVHTKPRRAGPSGTARASAGPGDARAAAPARPDSAAPGPAPRADQGRDRRPHDPRLPPRVHPKAVGSRAQSGLVGKVGQRLAAPQPERLAQQPGGALGSRLPERSAASPPNASNCKASTRRVHDQRIAARARLQDRRRAGRGCARPGCRAREADRRIPQIASISASRRNRHRLQTRIATSVRERRPPSATLRPPTTTSSGPRRTHTARTRPVPLVLPARDSYSSVR